MGSVIGGFGGAAVFFAEKLWVLERVLIDAAMDKYDSSNCFYGILRLIKGGDSVPLRMRGRTYCSVSVLQQLSLDQIFICIKVFDVIKTNYGFLERTFLKSRESD